MTETSFAPTNLTAQFALEAEPLLDALARRAQRLTFNHADAEELLQDTLLHAFSGFRTFEPGTNFRAWVFRILHNRWCSTYRSRQRRPAEVLTQHTDWDTGQKSAYAPRFESSAETEALASFRHSDVHAAMGTLPPVICDALYLTVVAGYSYADTAVMMSRHGDVASVPWPQASCIAMAHVVPVDVSKP